MSSRGAARGGQQSAEAIFLGRQLRLQTWAQCATACPQGERALTSLETFLQKRLRLQVNREKSAVDRPWKRSFLGYTVTIEREARLKVAPQSAKRLKDGL